MKDILGFVEVPIPKILEALEAQTKCIQGYRRDAEVRYIKDLIEKDKKEYAKSKSLWMKFFKREDGYTPPSFDEMERRVKQENKSHKSDEYNTHSLFYPSIKGWSDLIQLRNLLAMCQIAKSVDKETIFVSDQALFILQYTRYVDEQEAA